MFTQDAEHFAKFITIETMKCRELENSHSDTKGFVQKSADALFITGDVQGVLLHPVDGVHCVRVRADRHQCRALRRHHPPHPRQVPHHVLPTQVSVSEASVELSDVIPL